MEQRTLKQNSALHLYFTLLAEALNDAGFDAKKTLKPEIEIPWSPEMIKELIWRPVQEIYLRKKSTTQLDKQKDIDIIYEIVNRHIGERTGIHVPFPNIESAIDRENL